MRWWAILLIVAGVQAVALLVLWLVIRRKKEQGPAAAIVDSKDKRLEEELAAERLSKEKVTAELRGLVEEHKKLAAWYAENLTRIEEEARHAYEKLATDPAALDSKLDQLLGPAPGTGTGTPP